MALAARRPATSEPVFPTYADRVHMPELHQQIPPLIAVFQHAQQRVAERLMVDLDVLSRARQHMLHLSRLLFREFHA